MCLAVPALPLDRAERGRLPLGCAQEKLYALNPDAIASGEDKRTTLMIKNIPNKYTQKMLLATVDEQVRSACRQRNVAGAGDRGAAARRFCP